MVLGEMDTVETFSMLSLDRGKDSWGIISRHVSFCTERFISVGEVIVEQSDTGLGLAHVIAIGNRLSLSSLEVRRIVSVDSCSFLAMRSLLLRRRVLNPLLRLRQRVKLLSIRASVAGEFKQLDTFDVTTMEPSGLVEISRDGINPLSHCTTKQRIAFTAIIKGWTMVIKSELNAKLIQQRITAVHVSPSNLHH